MNLLIFEWKNFGIEDVCESLSALGHRYRCISDERIRDRVNPAFDAAFDRLAETGMTDGGACDAVFTFNYSPVVSNCCNRHALPYIAFVYDSPLVSLYSYTILNPCNHVFIFDKAQYWDLQKEQIKTVHYAPLAVNTARLDRQLKNRPAHADGAPVYDCDIAFVGSMYNEKHNLFDRFAGLPPYVKGYLDAVMQAQSKVYGYYFIEELLTPDILKALQERVPVSPNKDGVETASYLYAYYFIARKLAALERQDLLGAVSKRFNTRLYTQNPTPGLPEIHNMGPVDYYDGMPAVFAGSRINLNISLRSIRSGIPLRALDIMGAGGFLLSNYQADFYDFFTPGEDLVLFDSKEDLLDKCAYYLRHDHERRRIAQNGLAQIRAHHTWEIRLNQLFEQVLN